MSDRVHMRQPPNGAGPQGTVTGQELAVSMGGPGVRRPLQPTQQAQQAQQAPQQYAQPQPPPPQQQPAFPAPPAPPPPGSASAHVQGPAAPPPVQHAPPTFDPSRFVPQGPPAAELHQWGPQTPAPFQPPAQGAPPPFHPPRVGELLGLEPVDAARVDALAAFASAENCSLRDLWLVLGRVFGVSVGSGER